VGTRLVRAAAEQAQSAPGTHDRPREGGRDPAGAVGAVVSELATGLSRSR